MFSFVRGSGIACYGDFCASASERWEEWESLSGSGILLFLRQIDWNFVCGRSQVCFRNQESVRCEGPWGANGSLVHAYNKSYRRCMLINNTRQLYNGISRTGQWADRLGVLGGRVNRRSSGFGWSFRQPGVEALGLGNWSGLTWGASVENHPTWEASVGNHGHRSGKAVNLHEPISSRTTCRRSGGESEPNHLFFLDPFYFYYISDKTTTFLLLFSLINQIWSFYRRGIKE
jgi:hypothetical protein